MNNNALTHDEYIEFRQLQIVMNSTYGAQIQKSITPPESVSSRYWDLNRRFRKYGKEVA